MMAGGSSASKPPLGVRTLSICALFLGFIVTFTGIDSFLRDHEWCDALVFCVGVAHFVAGIDFYRFRKWSWWLGVGTILLPASLYCYAAICVMFHRENLKEGALISATLILICYPFLIYYLVRPRTRSLFGIGSRSTKTS